MAAEYVQMTLFDTDTMTHEHADGTSQASSRACEDDKAA